MSLPTYRISEVKSSDPKDLNQTIDQINRALDDIYSKQSVQVQSQKDRLIKSIVLGDNRTNVTFENLDKYGNYFELIYYVKCSLANASLFLAQNSDKTATNYRQANHYAGGILSHAASSASNNLFCDNVSLQATPKRYTGRAILMVLPDRTLQVINQYFLYIDAVDQAIGNINLRTLNALQNGKLSSIEIYANVADSMGNDTMFNLYTFD